ncbi:hypothetical protein HDU80_006160 [Chytriomyces hyalinus]|nr:hypothetical protein HDU80_006160 [Chytriomyces hyalinus]
MLNFRDTSQNPGMLHFSHPNAQPCPPPLLTLGLSQRHQDHDHMLTLKIEKPPFIVLPRNGKMLSNSSTLADLLGHAQTRIRHLTSQVHKPSHPFTVNTEVQTDPLDQCPLVEVAKVIPLEAHDEVTDSEVAQTNSQDTLNETESNISWETIDDDEIRKMADEWWHEFRYDQDLVGDNLHPLKETHRKGGVTSPNPERDSNHRCRIPLVTQIARPIFFGGLSWGDIEAQVMGPLPTVLSHSAPAVRDPSRALASIPSPRISNLPHTETDILLEKVSSIPGKYVKGKWRLYKDSITNTVKKDIIVDRIDMRSGHSARRIDELEELQEERLLDLIEADTGAGTFKSEATWHKWKELARRKCEMSQNAATPLDNAGSIIDRDDVISNRHITSNSVENWKAAYTEEAVIANALRELELRHGKDRAERIVAGYGSRPIVQPGVAGNLYFQRVWDKSQLNTDDT